MLLLVTCIAAGCGSLSSRVHDLASLNDFERLEVAGPDFVHVVYRRPTRSAARIHVYLEHDGLPWATPTRVSDDPTPRDPLALKLAIQDPESVIYLGRPCYFGMAHTSQCSFLIWTRWRYSDQVISNMAAALRRVLGQHQPEIVFFGHSGGGTLAWLLARHFPNTRAVVTVAANLDVDAWTALHGYTALSGSLSPADGPNLPPHILQVHYVGSEDTVVPSALVKNFVKQTPGALVFEYDGFDHRCCWERVWPAILRDIRLRTGAPSF